MSKFNSINSKMKLQMRVIFSHKTLSNFAEKAKILNLSASYAENYCKILSSWSVLLNISIFSIDTTLLNAKDTQNLSARRSITGYSITEAQGQLSY